MVLVEHGDLGRDGRVVAGPELSSLISKSLAVAGDSSVSDTDVSNQSTVSEMKESDWLATKRNNYTRDEFINHKNAEFPSDFPI